MPDSSKSPPKSGLKILIIGAGMAGVLMGIRLKQAGYSDFTLVEKGDRVGGTWRDNHYPGLHCDVPSHHYCYSFEPNADWSETFSSGPEIWGYLDRSAAKYGIIPHIRFNTEAVDAAWDGARWRVTLAGGEVVVADILVSAAGGLRVPVLPDIPGLETFAGPQFHTTQWDHDLPLANRRIGMIGTGSTAVQVTCALAGKIGKLSLFQRTAQWVAKIPNDPISAETQDLYRSSPELMRELYDVLERQTAVQTGGAIMGLDPVARAALKENVESNLATVRDPVLRQKLTPTYEVGCKRLVMSPSFYEAVQDPTVEVVTEKIDHVEAKGIVTADGTLHELDVLVLATGFDPGAYIRPMRLTGSGGHTLDELWAERPIAYHSMLVPHMPNFFMIEGPFSPFGNLSLILVAEWQVDYIMKFVEMIREKGVAVSPRADVTARLTDRYREEAKKTIWATGGCKSWYQDKDGVPIIYPYSPDQFRDDVKEEPNLGDFEIQKIANEPALAD
jgi:cation diffusion facilitator CzcD-associated flavoprotein CzcO